MLHRAGLRLQFAQQQAQQGALADPVVTHQPDAVAPHDLQVQAIDQRPGAEPETDVLGLDDLAAGQLRLADADARRPGPADTLSGNLAHGLECPDAPLVAGSTGLDALADPGLLLRQLAIELGVASILVLDRLGLAPQVLVIVAGPAHQLTPVYLDDTRGQPLQEGAVVRDEQHRAGPVGDTLLQPLDGGQVEMIGRLVEQQELGIADQGPGQRYAPTPAAGEFRQTLLAGELHVAEDRVHAPVQVPAIDGVDAPVQHFELLQAVLTEILRGQALVRLDQVAHGLEPTHDRLPHRQL